MLEMTNRSSIIQCIRFGIYEKKVNEETKIPLAKSAKEKVIQKASGDQVL